MVLGFVRSGDAFIAGEGVLHVNAICAYDFAQVAEFGAVYLFRGVPLR